MHDVSGETGRAYPAGWYVSGVYNLTPWLGIVDEGAAGYSRTEEVDWPVGHQSSKRQVSSIAAGARFFHKAGRLAPCGQFLVGAAIEQRSTTIPGTA